MRNRWGVSKQVCPWCSTERPVEDFWRNPATGWITKECRHCVEERLRLWAEVERAPVVVGRRYVDEGDGPLVCTRCGLHKARELFYTWRDRRKGTGLYYRAKCRQCMGAEQNERIRRNGRSPESRRADRDRWLRKKYGITLDEYERRLAEQDGRCAICRTDEPGGPTGNSAFPVDHDHATGRVRGLLCFPCNTAIGLLREDPVLFAAAAAYLGK